MKVCLSPAHPAVFLGPRGAQAALNAARIKVAATARNISSSDDLVEKLRRCRTSACTDTGIASAAFAAVNQAHEAPLVVS